MAAPGCMGCLGPVQILFLGSKSPAQLVSLADPVVVAHDKGKGQIRRFVCAVSHLPSLSSWRTRSWSYMMSVRESCAWLDTSSWNLSRHTGCRVVSAMVLCSLRCGLRYSLHAA